MCRQEAAAYAAVETERQVLAGEEGPGASQRSRLPKKIGTAEEPVLHGSIELARAPELGTMGSKAASATASIFQSQRRIAESEFQH
jgi:hypothetical protein